MADVQTDNGYVRIANQLMDELPKYKFNGTQLRIIMAVWRYTYGFQRKQHEMSLGFIEKATGIDKARVKKQLNGLIEANVILVVKEATFNKSRVLAFNKDFEEWEIERNEPQGSSKTEGSNHTTPQGSKEPTPQGSKRTPKKESIKDNIKETQAGEIFEHWLSKNIIQHKTFTADMKKKVKSAIKKHGVDEVKAAIDNYAKIFRSDDYWFDYKYQLVDMVRDKDIRQFGNEADPFYNFAKDKNKVQKTKQPIKVPERTEEEKRIDRIRELEDTKRLGRDYYAMTNEEHLYDEAVKELERLGQL